MMLENTEPQMMKNVITPTIAADLRKRAQTANDWGADYFISIHTNSSLDPAVNGF